MPLEMDPDRQIALANEAARIGDEWVATSARYKGASHDVQCEVMLNKFAPQVFRLGVIVRQLGHYADIREGGQPSMRDAYVAINKVIPEVRRECS